MRGLVFLFVLHLAYCSCPSGFELVRDGECRGNYTRINTFHDEGLMSAIAKCSEIQGQPIIIHNDEHQSYWKSQMTMEWAIIGLACNINTKQWEWFDGSAMDYNTTTGHDPILDNPCIPGYVWLMRSDGWWGVYHAGHKEMTSDIFCTTQLQHPVPSADGCATFQDDSDDGVCYQIGVTAENWQEAQLICKSFEADAASIHNQKENSFIRRLAVSKGEVKGIYLGATISGKGTDFAWTDGSEWDYDNFNPGFPLNGFGDCLAMDTEATSGQWLNVDCNSKLSVACIRQQNYTIPKCTSGPWKEGQIIYSPGFPYDASGSCDFILTVEAGKRVEVEILMLEANSCCDHVILYDSYIAGNILANLTGEMRERVYSSPSNSMRVSWQPNGGANVRGMMMTYRAV